MKPTRLDIPFSAELEEYSVNDLIKALQAGTVKNIEKIEGEMKAVMYVALHKRHIGTYRFPFPGGGFYTIFVYPAMDAIVFSAPKPDPGSFERPDNITGYKHIYDFMEENQDLSHEPQFQRMAQELDFRIKPQSIPFKTKKPIVH